MTIVVIAHQARRDLERCLASIDAHGAMPVQVVLVDNASTDGTAEWVARAQPDVDVVRLPRNVGDAARNQGLRRARAPYTMFLDSDAALTPGALPELVRALDEHPGWGLVAPRLVHEDGRLQRSCRRFPPLLAPVLRRPPLDRFFEGGPTVARHLMADFDHATSRPVPYTISAAQLFRTGLARRIGPFDERSFYGWGDADWCFRIRDAGGEVVFLPAATVVHSYQRRTRRRPLSMTALRQLRDFAAFQWRYRRRRRELIGLGERLDAEAR